MSQDRSPFKFLDAYQQADAGVFFGREKETHDLYNALSGVKHLLVYGPSGAGKTSLIECGLRNQFSDADWFAITIRKGADINASVFASINEALQEKIVIDPTGNIPADQQMEFGPAIEKLFAERYQPVYLLFDQFEELLISGADDEKKTFFILLNKLIRNKVPCRILLIMREEFIGHLSEFEPLCPSIFQHRFRVEKMGRKNVEEVIYSILEAPGYKSSFSTDDSRALTASILSKLPDKKKEIELAHVQVFLGELWDRAQLAKKNNEQPLLQAALIRSDDNLEAVLESFLKKQIKELENNYGEKVPLELLAAMITEKFTKLQLSEAALQKDLEHKNVISKKAINGLLKDLELRRIIRTVKLGDETQYEISHDVLALVVGQNLTEEMKMREKAADIYKVYQERQGLFTQDDIDYMRPFQQSLLYPAELQVRIGNSIVFLKKQQEQDLIKTNKRLRTLYGLLGFAAVALVVAVVFYFNANAATKKAKTSESNAKIAYKTADSLQMVANRALKNIINRDFYNIVKLTEPITDVGGIPQAYLMQLDSIASLFPNKTELNTTIDSIKNIIEKNNKK
ncbi:MAG: ATP-binding protein [Chitinophagaceae bacterium]